MDDIDIDLLMRSREFSFKPAIYPLFFGISHKRMHKHARTSCACIIRIQIDFFYRPHNEIRSQKNRYPL